MAIRIREVDGKLVALCAAKHEPAPGDIYLPDPVQYALSLKFYEDFKSMGFISRD